MFPLVLKLPLAVGNQLLHRDVVRGERGKGKFSGFSVKMVFVVGTLRDSNTLAAHSGHPIHDGTGTHSERFGGFTADAVTLF